jgi:hypothetical protein
MQRPLPASALSANSGPNRLLAANRGPKRCLTRPPVHRLNRRANSFEFATITVPRMADALVISPCDRHPTPNGA